MGNCVSSGAAAVLPDEHIVGTVSPPTEFALYATAAAPETLGVCYSMKYRQLVYTLLCGHLNIFWCSSVFLI